MDKLSIHLKQLIAQIHKIEQEITATIVAVEAERHYAGSFRNEGFTDKSLKPWPKRKKKESPRRALLVRTGALRRHATTAHTRGSHVDFVFALPYAKRHNEGDSKMPQRQFIGQSEVLDIRIKQKVNSYFKRYLKGL